MKTEKLKSYFIVANLILFSLLLFFLILHSFKHFSGGAENFMIVSLVLFFSLPLYYLSLRPKNYYFGLFGLFFILSVLNFVEICGYYNCFPKFLYSYLEVTVYIFFFTIGIIFLIQIIGFILILITNKNN